MEENTESIGVLELLKATLKTMLRDIVPLLAATGAISSVLGGLMLMMPSVEESLGMPSILENVIMGLAITSVVWLFLGSPWFVGGAAALLKHGATHRTSRFPKLVLSTCVMGVTNSFALWALFVGSLFLHARFATLTPMMMAQPEGAPDRRSGELTRGQLVPLALVSLILHAIYGFMGVLTLMSMGALTAILGEDSPVYFAMLGGYLALFPMIFGAYQLAAYEELK